MHNYIDSNNSTDASARWRSTRWPEKSVFI